MKPFAATSAGVLIAVALSGCATALALDAKLQCAAEPDSASPVRTSGEFPFRVVYVGNGRRSVLEDTQVCRLKSNGCAASGRTDTWEGTLKSGKPDSVIHSEVAGEETRRFVVAAGACSALMENADYVRKEQNPIYAVALKRYRNGKLVGGSGALGATHELSRLGIQIISFEQWSDSAKKDP